MDNDRVVLMSDDGTKLRGIAPGEEIPSGWHVMTEAETNEQVDLMVEEVAERLAADIAPTN